MSKEESITLKGVAILFMLWLHCFNLNIPIVQGFHCNGNEWTLSYMLTRATGPVELYILLSGYGIYHTFIMKSKTKPLKRIFKLLILYSIS